MKDEEGYYYLDEKGHKIRDEEWIIFTQTNKYNKTYKQEKTLKRLLYGLNQKVL